jgi:subfamily B ATP-binding cassette protein MsbA
MSEPNQDQAPRRAASIAWSELRRLAHPLGTPRWAIPVLAAMGFASALAETLGVSLIVVFFYSVSGHADSAGALLGQTSGRLIALLSQVLGSPEALAAGIVLLVLTRVGLALLYGRVSTLISEQINARCRELVHRQYLDVAYAFLRRHEQATLMEVLGTDSWAVSEAARAIARLAVNVLSVATFMLFLTAISWRITLVAAAGILVISLCLRGLSEPSRRLGERLKAAHRALGEHMLVSLQSMRTIRAYGLEAQHQTRFEAASTDARRAITEAAQLMGWINPVTEAGYLCVLGLIVLGMTWWHVGFAETLACVALLYRLQPHAREFEGHLLSLAHLGPQLTAVRRMLDRNGKPYLPAGTVRLEALQGPITFENVTFSYAQDQAPVLDDVTFAIPIGKRTALVGASGAGKTTVVNLLLRLYAPDAGRIAVGGVSIADIRRDDWLRRFAVAGQDVDLIEGTVLENLQVARPDATVADVLAAAELTRVSQFVADLPEAYDTWVGQEGLRFSGGQRQRISLARAVLRDADVIILDEATSSLDHALADSVSRAIEDHMSRRTRLVITHRLDTLRAADHLVWLDQGRVRYAGRPMGSGLFSPGALDEAAPTPKAPAPVVENGVNRASA